MRDMSNPKVFLGPATDLRRLLGPLVTFPCPIDPDVSRTGHFGEIVHDLNAECIKGSFNDLYGAWRYDVTVPYGTHVELIKDYMEWQA